MIGEVSKKNRIGDIDMDQKRRPIVDEQKSKLESY